jgi:MFS-type transporter involved in bile tolerance (Atg22 family)
MSLTKSGLTMALFSYIPSLTAALLGGLWADRWAKSKPTGRLSTQVISLGLMAPAVLAMGFMPSGTTMAANLLVYSLATGIVNVNSMPVFTSVIPARRWSTAYGVYNLVGTLPGGLGVLLVGVMKARWGIGYGLSSTSVPLFLAFALLTYALFRFYPNDIKKLQEETLRENASGGSAPSLASAS